MLRPDQIPVWNAHKLEVAELAGADPRLVLHLTWEALFATFPGEEMPVDVVDR